MFSVIHTRRRAASLTLAILLCLSAMTLLTGCSTKTERENQRTVGVCNGYEIPYEELRFVTMLYKDNLVEKYGEGIWDDPASADAHRAELEAEVMEHLRENYVILSACAERGLPLESDAADNYVEDQIDKMIQESFGGKTAGYREFLEEQHLTDHYFRFSLKVSYLESALFYSMLDGGEFAYTKENLTEYIDYVLQSPDYARIIHVYLRNDEGENPEQNLKDAQNITLALRAVHNSEDRLRVMNQYIGSTYNDDMDMVTKDGYYFTRGEMNKTYEEAAFALQIGEVSDPIECSGGYFVLMRLEPEEAYVMSNSSTLLTNWQSARMGFIEDSYRAVCEPILTEEGLAIDLAAMQ